MSTHDTLNYDDYQAFNQYLDDETGTINIAGESFAPSYVLFELAQETYRIAKTEYDEQIEQEAFEAEQEAFETLQKAIYEDFPACIAFPYRLSEKGKDAEDPVRKLFHLKDTWEGIIFVIYALVMGEVRRKAIPFASIKVLDSRSQELNLNMARLTSDALRAKIQNVRAIIQFSKSNGFGFKLEEIDETLLDDLDALHSIRNDLSHLTTPTNEQAEQELLLIKPILQQMLSKARFLERCRILRFATYSDKCRCEIFNGHSLNREYETLTVDPSQLPYILGLTQEQIFVQWDDAYYSLSPFMHFEKDQTGHESYICFYKEKSGGKYWYEPVKMRQQRTFDSLQVRFEAHMTELAGLFR